MEFNDIIKYLGDNLNIEVETSFEGDSDNQSVTVKLKIGDVVISESSAFIFVPTGL